MNRKKVWIALGVLAVLVIGLLVVFVIRNNNKKDAPQPSGNGETRAESVSQDTAATTEAKSDPDIELPEITIPDDADRDGNSDADNSGAANGSQGNAGGAGSSGGSSSDGRGSSDDPADSSAPGGDPGNSGDNAGSPEVPADTPEIPTDAPEPPTDNAPTDNVPTDDPAPTDGNGDVELPEVPVN